MKPPITKLPVMKLLYVLAGLGIYFKMMVFPNPAAELAENSIVEMIVQESGVSNAVSGIIFRNRLYDTLFEVVVFTLSVMGVRYLLADEQPAAAVYRFTDAPSIVLARLGATIAALIAVELAIRGHLSPGGGFAAGVAGGTAIGLIAITSSSEKMAAIYQRWKAATWEKVSVLIFLIFATLSLIGIELPQGELGALLSGGWLPIFNTLVAIKVALGSWAIIIIFVRHRGLL